MMNGQDTPPERDPFRPELSISHATVCGLIAELRAHWAWLSRAAATDDDDSTMDPAASDDSPDDPGTEAAIAAVLADLSLEEQAQLMALTEIGRGDADICDWPRLVTEAYERVQAGEPAIDVDQEATAQELAAGLEAFGYSCGA